MRFAAAVVSTCVMVAGMTTPTAAQVAVARYTPPPIQWGTCADLNLRKAGATCGDLVVPLDYARPGGAKITLAVSRVLHTSPDTAYQGVMLTNPGGPGGSGLNLAALAGSCRTMPVTPTTGSVSTRAVSVRTGRRCRASDATSTSTGRATCHGPAT